MSRLKSAPAAPPAVVDWQQFHTFLLQRMNETTAKDRLMYCRRFAGVLLQTGSNDDVQDLLQLQPNKRLHIMKAISCLARYTGRYNDWLVLRQKHGLTWTTGTEKVDAFTRFFDDGKSLDKMIGWLKEALKVLPWQHSNIFLFTTLTGLRIPESLASIKLIKDPETFSTYYDPKNQVLRHYIRPETFIRRSKAVFISLADDQIIGIAQQVGKAPTYNALKMVCRRRKLSMRLKYCRKIYASWLRQSGIESEIVDMLQGRVPKTVFARHYFTPSLDYRVKVLEALHRLRKEIIDKGL
jgi:hypothetical protein